ncbi:MAG: hypothetical protein AB7T49_08335 [Oligoflexales bacterium]
MGLKFVAGKLAAALDANIEPKSVSCPTADGKLGNDFLGTFALYIPANRKYVEFYQ